MRTGSFTAPLVAGLIGLAGMLGVTVFLHRAAARSLDQVLEERLRGAGRAAAGLLSGAAAGEERLRTVMTASDLEGALLLAPDLTVLADATGPEGGRVDLLRVDRHRVAAAFAGQASVAFGWSVGEAQVAVGYFPVPGSGAPAEAVLALEAGEAFGGARGRLRQALGSAVVLSLLVAAALALGAWRWNGLMASRREEAARALRGEAIARMAATVAHEVRNPAGVVRGSVELVRARAGPSLAEVDREALLDVLHEVDRLTRLTDDFLDLARDPRLALAPVDLAAIADEAARAARSAHPQLGVEVRSVPLPVRADASRLHQVLANLLRNAAQAGARSVLLEGRVSGRRAVLRVRDDGAGVDPALRDRLFEPFATSRKDGTGLGLALARRLVEQQGGALSLLEGAGPGAEFELWLPRWKG
jgi:signal transduction histidine kinase